MLHNASQWSKWEVLKMVTVVNITVSLISYPDFSELINRSESQELHLLSISPSRTCASAEPLVEATTPGTDQGVCIDCRRALHAPHGTLPWHAVSPDGFSCISFPALAVILFSFPLFLKFKFPLFHLYYKFLYRIHIA